MVALKNSILTKLTASFIILILLISGLTFIYTYGATKDALKESMRDELTQVAGVMATQIDGDSIVLLNKGDETTPAFLAQRDKLVNMRSTSSDITNAYIMKKSGNDIVFVVDDEWGTESDAAHIGEVYNSDFSSTIQDGFSAPTATPGIYTDAWGTFLSGVAPIKDSKGNVVAVLGVDMKADKVIERQNFIGNTIYLIIAVSALIAGILIALFARSLIRDINSLNETANKISMGDTSVTVNVRRKDEIGELADSFSRMVASLKIMMDTDEK
ncbi:HAMP domain-containing protein [Methanoregula sp.]|uniref:HAMP domain-containing protein n=1 Tax=Methanoregula sp. TaxID=2052170 RepID=UPI003565BA7F